MSRRWRLILASAAFLGWLSYLGYAALSKNRSPVISRVQAAAATYAVVAEVAASPQGKPEAIITVVESLGRPALPAGSRRFVTNLAGASGFEGPGKYLLLLIEEPTLVETGAGGEKARALSIVGQLRSPGNDLTGVGPPKVYRWTDELRRQFEGLPKPSEPRR